MSFLKSLFSILTEVPHSLLCIPKLKHPASSIIFCFNGRLVSLLVTSTCCFTSNSQLSFVFVTSTAFLAYMRCCRTVVSALDINYICFLQAVRIIVSTKQPPLLLFCLFCVCFSFGCFYIKCWLRATSTRTRSVLVV